MGVVVCVWHRALIAVNAGLGVALVEEDCQLTGGQGSEPGAGSCQRSQEAVQEPGLPEDAGSDELRYRAAVAKDPRRVGAWVRLGQTLMARARLTEAEGSFRRALALAPREAAAQLDLGALLFERGAMQEAEQSFRAVLEVTPGSEEARHNLAVLLQRSLRYQEAIQVLEPLLEGSEGAGGSLPPASAELYQDLLDKVGRWDEAESRLRRGGSAGGLGRHLLRRGRLEEAESVLRAVTSRRSATADLGTTLWLLGRKAEAESSWRDALEHSKQGLSPAHFLVSLVDGEEAYQRFRAQEVADFKDALLQMEPPVPASSLSAALEDLRRLENDTAWLLRWASERAEVCGTECPYARLTFPEWQAMASRPALRPALQGGALLTLGSGLGEDCIFALASGFSRCLLFDILCESMVASAKDIAERHGYAQHMDYRCANMRRLESFGKGSLVRIPQGPACDLECRRGLHGRLSRELAPGALIVSASLPLADGLRVVDKFVVQHQYKRHLAEVLLLEKFD